MSAAMTQVRITLLREAFDLVLAQWPDVILPGDKSFHLGGGCNMRTLNETHAPIEAWLMASQFKDELDTIMPATEHYLFTSIHSALRDLTKISKVDIDFDAFASRFDSSPHFRVVPD